MEDEKADELACAIGALIDGMGGSQLQLEVDTILDVLEYVYACIERHNDHTPRHKMH